MIKKRVMKIFGVLLFVAGLFLLINARLNLTGAFLGFRSTANFVSFFLGVIMMFFAIVVFSTAGLTLEKKLTLSSSIKKYPSILRLTQDAVKNQDVQRELNHLTEELYKGNFEAGLGHPGHIEGTEVHYLRGRNGARLYWRRRGEHDYEIVGKSAKGRNQEQVIDKLRQIYS